MEQSLSVLEKAPKDYKGFAVIGGSGAYDIAMNLIGEVLGELSLDTPFGRVSGIRFLGLESATGPVAFISRHGWTGYTITAPDVNYRANIWALKEIGTTRILSWSGPGSVDPNFTPGDYVLPEDLIDLTSKRENTFFTGTGLGFIRQNPVFCPTMREVLVRSLERLGADYRTGAVYAVTEGPRLETPAEVRMIKRLGGQLVGMTLAPEAFLATELEICYHACCYVANWAEGVKELPYRTGELFEGMVEENLHSRVENAVQGFADIVRESASGLSALKERTCHCASAMERYRRAGRIGPDWRTWILRPGQHSDHDGSY